MLRSHRSFMKFKTGHLPRRIDADGSRRLRPPEERNNQYPYGKSCKEWATCYTTRLEKAKRRAEKKCRSKI